MRYEYRSALKRAVVIAAAAATSGVALADADLDQKIADSANWAAQAGDYSNHRYSELKQINTGAGVSAHALPVGGCRASVREVCLSAGVTKSVDS
jgi:hypothetical protein